MESLIWTQALLARAVARDPSCVEAHLALASLYSSTIPTPEKAERALRRAVQVSQTKAHHITSHQIKSNQIKSLLSDLVNAAAFNSLSYPDFRPE